MSISMDLAKDKYYANCKKNGQNPAQEKNNVQEKQMKQQQVEAEKSLTAAGMIWSDEQASVPASSLAHVSQVPQNQQSSTGSKVGHDPADPSLLFAEDEGDMANLSSSVIIKDQPAKALSVMQASVFALEEVKEKIKKKILDAFEDSYGGCFSHNRLLGKLASVKAGFFSELLTRFGVSAQEIDNVRAEARKKLCDQNRLGMEQIVYDETLLQIII